MKKKDKVIRDRYVFPPRATWWERVLCRVFGHKEKPQPVRWWWICCARCHLAIRRPSVAEAEAAWNGVAKKVGLGGLPAGGPAYPPPRRTPVRPPVKWHMQFPGGRAWLDEYVRKVQGREETGLCPQEADALRIACRKAGRPMPTEPAEMRSAYEALVKKQEAS